MHSVNNTERMLYKICPVERQSLKLCEKGNNTTTIGLALHIKLFHLHQIVWYFDIHKTPLHHMNLQWFLKTTLLNCNNFFDTPCISGRKNSEFDVIICCTSSFVILLTIKLTN